MDNDKRLAQLEASVASLALSIPTPQRPPAAATTTTTQTSSGAYYFEPVTILDATTTVIDWTTLDLSQYGVASGAKEAIFDCWGRIDLPDAGTDFPFLYFRKNDSQINGYILTHSEASSGGDRIAFGCQGRFPVSSSRTIDYQLTTPGFNLGFTLRIIGYVL